MKELIFLTFFLAKENKKHQSIKYQENAYNLTYERTCFPVTFFLAKLEKSNREKKTISQ